MMGQLMTTVLQQQGMIKELSNQHSSLAREVQKLTTSNLQTVHLAVLLLKQSLVFVFMNMQGFVTQCTLVLRLQPSQFPTEEAKVAYVITRLGEQALD